MAAAETEAAAYYRDLSQLSAQATAVVLRMWRHVGRGDIARSWSRLLPEVVAAVVGAQTVAAEATDPYLTALVGAGPTVNVEAFAAATQSGGDLAGVYFLPTIDARAAIGRGVQVGTALRDVEASLAMYTRTLTADAGRDAVQVGMVARPHVRGYYRMLRPPSCARCAILAGKFFRWNTGFQRHPRCDCVHIPVAESDDSLLFDARKAIAAGRVTGLSRADREAILEHGADPSQVVNARRGMYSDSAGRRFTTEGATRRGVAGARILARDVERALGRDTRGRTFTNFGFDRLKAAQYAELFRRGKTFHRVTGNGRVQTYSYRFARSGRPTPGQILADATSREEVIRLLTNFGYIL